MSWFHLTHVSVALDKRVVVGGVSAQLERGEPGAIVGPDSAGKTTPPRAIAGPIAPSAGTLRG